MTRRELTMKPSFASEVLAFPAEQTRALWEKIGWLVDDPLPDGHQKKKLKGQAGVYRLRMGSFRILYTFGEGWVRLLGIRRRTDTTYSAGMTDIEAEAPPVLPVEQGEVDLDELEDGEGGEEAPRWAGARWGEASGPASTPLPRALSVEWLRSLRIEDAWLDRLVVAQTEEALLAADVPAAVLDRVLDQLFPRSVEEVLQQPDLALVGGVQDLVRFHGGELREFLLKLDPEQERLCDFALKGPTLLRGGPGTGKSTVALYRVRALLSQPGSTGQERVLFTTFTRSLTRMNQQLLEQLLSAEQRARVEVCTLDQLVRRILLACGEAFEPASGPDERRALEAVLAEWTPEGANAFERQMRRRRVLRLSVDYLLDELRWILQGHRLATLEAYQQAPRQGRRVPFNASMREAVWSLYGAWRAAPRRAASFAELRERALECVRSGRFTERWAYVLVDEAQDFAPAALELVAELAAGAEGVFLAADLKQTIHARGVSLQGSHPRLDFRGRTRSLRRNFRSTAEIARAASALLRGEAGEEGAGECVHSGPLPTLIRCPPGPEEARHVARFIRQASALLRFKAGAAGVLVPSEALGRRVAEALCREGVAARFVKGDAIDLSSSEVKVITLQSAKGLEFPIVAICALEEGTFPSASRASSAEELEEQLVTWRKLLYVGMTRAMRGLMLVLPAGVAHPALDHLDLEHWNVPGEAA